MADCFLPILLQYCDQRDQRIVILQEGKRICFALPPDRILTADLPESQEDFDDCVPTALLIAEAREKIRKEIGTMRPKSDSTTAVR